MPRNVQWAMSSAWWPEHGAEDAGRSRAHSACGDQARAVLAGGQNRTPATFAVGEGVPGADCGARKLTSMGAEVANGGDVPGRTERSRRTRRGPSSSALGSVDVVTR